MMGIYLGNLSVEQIESEDYGHNFKFTEEEREYLKRCWHKRASFDDRESGWHMFDMPRRLEVSPDEIGEKIIEIFKSHNSEIEGCIEVAYAWERGA